MHEIHREKHHISVVKTKNKFILRNDQDIAQHTFNWWLDANDFIEKCANVDSFENVRLFRRTTSLLIISFFFSIFFLLNFEFTAYTSIATQVYTLYFVAFILMIFFLYLLSFNMHMYDRHTRKVARKKVYIWICE